jgi:beta-xylosidase
VFTSPDLITWIDRDWVLVEDDSWGSREFWAPEVIRKDNTYYMYYTVEERICVASSSSPLGPFKQDIQEPIEPDSIRIDSHVFKNDDDRYYLYYVAFNNGNEIWAAELNDDMRTIKPDTRRLMIAPDQEWEKNMANVNEGPYVLKHNGIYYLTYSGSHVASTEYGVGYATASHPLGPWTKYAHNPILKSTHYVHGTGHHGFAPSPDGSELFIVYHTHYDLKTSNPAKRQMAIDRIHFVPQANGPDVLEMWGPTVSPQPKPQEAPHQ